MLQSIQKFMRTMKRDYLPAVFPDGSATRSKTLGLCLGMTWALCLAVVICIPAASVGAAIFGLGVSAVLAHDQAREIRKEMAKRNSGEIEAENGDAITLAGPGRNIATIENTQKLVKRMTAAHESAAELPPKVQAKLAPYIEDCAQAAETVDALVASEPQARIPLLRETFAGNAVAATVLTPLGLQKKKKADYDTAVAASVEQCHSGLPEAVKVRTLRLKKGFLSCWNP